MQLPKTAKNRNLETVRIRVLPPVLLAPLRRPSPAPLRRPATTAPLLLMSRIFAAYFNRRRCRPRRANRSSGARQDLCSIGAVAGKIS
ncbi:hypothetical protein A8D96_30425 [Burkholderia cenocepacia]|nr:hypothetical protein A8D96_30425 [Burkholderia cenocepacia]